MVVSARGHSIPSPDPGLTMPGSAISLGKILASINLTDSSLVSCSFSTDIYYVAKLKVILKICHTKCSYTPGNTVCHIGGPHVH